LVEPLEGEAIFIGGRTDRQDLAIGVHELHAVHIIIVVVDDAPGDLALAPPRLANRPLEALLFARLLRRAHELREKSGAVRSLPLQGEGRELGAISVPALFGGDEFHLAVVPVFNVFGLVELKAKRLLLDPHDVASSDALALDRARPDAAEK